MITVFNAQNYAQQWFFDKAFAILKAKGKLNDQELKYERFLSLDGYFAHMSDLIAIEPSYVLIPSDEEPFVIDANARTISIPAAFNKCAGVVGDDMCEIITFTIDRYFDYVDLATANICIQWEANGHKGISHISLLDLGTVPGKIRFGWPLTKELTGAPGAVKFAVRFFIKNKDTDKYVYLLNTLTTTINIKDSLNIEKPEIEEETVHDLFGQFVQNTINPTYPTPAPVYFDKDIGIQLPEQEKVAETTTLEREADTLVLEAQALVSDNGHINYQWYFKEGATPANKESRYVLAENWDENAKYYVYDSVDEVYVRAYPMTEGEFDKGTYFILEELFGTPLTDADPRFEIGEYYKKINTPKERHGAEQYFIEDETNPGVFKLVTDKELPHGVQLYERISRLKIVKTEDVGEGGDPTAITGLYWVGASNYVGADRYEIDNEQYPEEGKIYAINHSPEINSKYCYVPTPAPVIILKNLPEDLFMVEQEDESLKATLQVELKEDTGLPERTFAWKRNPNGKAYIDDAEDAGTGVDLNPLEFTDPEKAGWYYVNVESRLNRASTNNTSAICRVLKPIDAPLLQKMEYARWTEDAEENPEEYFANEDRWTVIYDINNPDEVIEMSKDVARRGDVIRLRITTDMDDEPRTTDSVLKPGLRTDALEYSWHVITLDEGARPLNPSDIDPTGNGIIPYNPNNNKYLGLGRREIDIQCKENDVETSFYCVVKNTLANKEASLSEQDYKVVFKVW